MKKEELEALKGSYKMNIQGQELILTFTVEEAHLKGMQVWNGFTFEMYPESATRFFNADDGTEFEFSMDENGIVEGITIYEGSQEYFFRKI